MKAADTIDGIRLRPAAEDDLAACAEIHRVALDGYLAPLGLPIVTWDPGPLVGLFSHLRSTDPDRFIVAERGGGIIAFASAWVRDGVWFLAMLFVLPGEQARGVGTLLLEAVLPRPGEAGPDGAHLRLGVATDSAQPISNALYARYGMVPRLPTLLLQGPILRPDAFPALPAGVVAAPFREIEAIGADGPGAGGAEGIVAAIDRAVIGYAHPEDHRYLAGIGRLGHLYADGEGRPRGYGYVRVDGRLGPVAALDAELVPAILGHLAGTIPAPVEGFTLVVTGSCDTTVTAALRAGLRIAEMPTLFCWDRPIADFSRYIPIGNALL